MYAVYAIYNKQSDKFYIGQTRDLKERLRLHNERVFQCYTSHFDGEWVLIHKEEFNSRKEALSREKQLKSYRGRQFIKSLLEV